MKEQRVVWLSGGGSFLMAGDPDVARFRGVGTVDEPPKIDREGTLRLGRSLSVVPAGERDGQALPAMLADGWRVASLTTAGGGAAYALLERDKP